MPLRLLPPLSSVFADAVRLARDRFWTLLALALLPAIPIVLVIPFLAQVFVAFDAGVTAGAELTRYTTPWIAGVALLGLLLSVVVSVASAAGIFVVLGAARDPGPRGAFRDGARRWLAYLWTQALVVVTVILVLVPTTVILALRQSVFMPGPDDARALSLLTTLLALILAVPAFIVISWYAFAPVLAARGDTWGVDALRLSHHLVEGLAAHVFGFLFAWLLFELLLSLILGALFPGLTLFANLVHYLTSSILGSAYLFTLYQAVRRA